MLGIPTWAGFAELTDILVVADNDTTPERNFASVQEQLRSAHYGVMEQKYDVPNAPLNKSDGTPSIAIMMMPENGKIGKLETLCLAAAQDAAPMISNCVNAFANCANTLEWPSPTLDEMKLRSLLGARHKRNPSIGLGKVWSEDPELIPLDNHCFDGVVSFLKTYPA